MYLYTYLHLYIYIPSYYTNISRHYLFLVIRTTTNYSRTFKAPGNHGRYRHVRHRQSLSLRQYSFFALSLALSTNQTLIYIISSLLFAQISFIAVYNYIMMKCFPDVSLEVGFNNFDTRSYVVAFYSCDNRPIHSIHLRISFTRVAVHPRVYFAYKCQNV